MLLVSLLVFGFFVSDVDACVFFDPFPLMALISPGCGYYLADNFLAFLSDQFLRIPESQSTLALFMFGILTSDIHFPAASNNPAIFANFLHRALYFHLPLTDPGRGLIFLLWLEWLEARPLSFDPKDVWPFSTSFVGDALSLLLSGVFFPLPLFQNLFAVAL